jgi:hypothetical protein
MGNMDPPVGFPPTLCTAQCPKGAVRGAWCLHPHARISDANKGQGLPVSLCGSNKSRKEEGEAFRRRHAQITAVTWIQEPPQ